MRATFVDDLDIMNREYRLRQLLVKGKILKKNYKDLTLEERASLVSRKYGESIVFFVKRLREVKPNFKFIYLENNIDFLEVEDVSLMKNNIRGTYSGKENKIILDRDYGYSAIYHELMHMASSYVYDDGYQESGFRQFAPNKFDIGLGLNEGYTELLTQRYFFDVDREGGYSISISYSKNIENIVGREKMEEYYFNGDLNSLIDELLKDATMEDIIQFLDDATWLAKRDENVSSCENVEHIQRMGNFVYLTYIKKLMRLFGDKKITYDELMILLDKVISNITYCYVITKKCNIWKCNTNNIQDELNKLGIKVEIYSREELEKNIGNFYVSQDDEIRKLYNMNTKGKEIFDEKSAEKSAEKRLIRK